MPSGTNPASQRPFSGLVMDGLFLEPPEPFVQTMAMLQRLPQGQSMLVLLPREPFPLFRVLDDSGFQYSRMLRPDGVFEITIWHAT